MAKLQQTIAFDNTTFALFKSWAGDITAGLGTGTGISAALQTLGFTRNVGGTGTGGIDKYQAIWDNGTTIGAGALPTAAGTLGSSTVFGTVSANKDRPPLAGTHFLGVWTNVAHVLGDVVIGSTGTLLTYVCTTANSTNTDPASNLTQWSPYWMEIWKMAGSGGTSNVFIKLEYGNGATATNPQFFVQLGSAYVADSGVLSGNVTTCEQGALGTGTNAALECTWTGDGANYFGMMLGRNNSSTQMEMMFWERGISGQASNAPVYSTTGQYVFFGKWYGINSGAVWSSALFLTGTLAQSLRIQAWESLSIGFNAAPISYVSGNLTPAFPVFPVIGYVGNPCTVVIAAIGTDMTEGALITSTVYGALHTYLMTKNQAVTALPTGVSSGLYAIGLRFD